MCRGEERTGRASGAVAVHHRAPILLIQNQAFAARPFGAIVVSCLGLIAKRVGWWTVVSQNIG